MSNEKDSTSFRFMPSKKWFANENRPEPFIDGKTIPEAYLKACARLGSKYISDAEAILGELDYAKSRVVTLLIADSVKSIKAERIGIFMPSLAATDHLLIGCIMAGKVPVPLNWTLGRKSLEHVLKSAELTTILTSKKVWSRMDNVPKDLFEDKLMFLEDILKAGATPWGKLKAFVKSLLPVNTILSLYGRKDVKEDDVALILFTSGSENLPKGVPLTHKNLLINSGDSAEALLANSQDSIFSILPPFHSYGLTTSVVLPMVAGVRTVHYPNPLDYKNLAQMLEDWKMTILPATPTFLKGIIKAGRPEQLQYVLKIVSGGERTPQEVFDGYEKICPQARLREGYGVTECSPVIAVGDYKAPRTVGVGKPFTHVEAAIVSLETGEKLSAMQEGIICVTGPSVFGGYLDRSLKSPFLEFDGKTWYNTGDIGYLTEEGVIVISGRLKRFVKIGGEMISLPALEQILEAKWPSNAMGPSLALQYFEGDGKPFIVMLTTQDIDKTEVNNALKEGGFSNLARISQVLKVEKIPLQGTGKTDFRALKEMAESLLNQ